MSADPHMTNPRAEAWPLARRVFSPFAVLLYIYVVYFALTYSRIYEYVYWELMNLGTRIIGFHPSLETLGLYVWGGVVLALGFVGGSIMATTVEARARRVDGRPQAVSRWIGVLVERVRSWRLLRPISPAFALSLLGWALGFAANASQVLASGSVSLTNIATRWAQSPVLVFVAAAQILFVPALMITARGRWQRLLAILAFVTSVLALGLLGARNLPAKLVVSGFLAAVYVVKPKTVVRLAIAALVLLVLAMGVIGAISKSGIYGPSATAGLAVALTYSDSVGTAYNLDRIVRLTPPTGVYHGSLLRDSALAAVPGIDAEYANYQIGRYLSGRESFTIGSELIERSVSLAPSLVGAPYADWGVAGAAAQMLLIGGVFGYLQERAKRSRLLIPFLVAMASYVINGVNAGIHNPHALIYLGLAIVAVLADAAVFSRLPLGSTIDDEVAIA